MKIRWLSLLVLLALALASCASSTTAEPLASNPEEASSDELPATSTENPLPFDNTPESKEMPSTPPPAEKFISLAKQDLAERLKVNIEGITLVQAAEMTWPNAALGCPSPGKVYAQGRVPGYRIRLETGGVEYVYNTDLSGQIILCPQSDPDDLDSLLSPTVPGPTPQIGVPIK